MERILRLKQMEKLFRGCQPRKGRARGALRAL
jgi:hypothetical protein